MKFCKKCKIEKETRFFNKNKRMKDGLYSFCAECRRISDKKYQEKAIKRASIWAKNNKDKVACNRERNKENKAVSDKKYYENNKEKILYKNKQYVSLNKEKLANSNKRYYFNNKEKLKTSNKEYRSRNKEKIKENKKIYYTLNKLKIREKAKEKYLLKYKNDILFRVSVCIRSRLRQAIKKSFKSGSAVKDLGCSITDLKKYLESKFQPGMNWDNYGPKGWHIDHIKPLSSFNLNDRSDFLKAVHYTNLQPLWAVDNLKKGSK